MNYGLIGTENKYNLISDKFLKAFAFLNRKDLETLPIGRINLGNGVTVDVQQYSTSYQNELPYETHAKFFDIQFLIEGQERIKICLRPALLIKKEYDEANDVTYYEDPSDEGFVLLTPGCYVILTPEDGHKSRCVADKPCMIKKIVVKVPVEETAIRK